jgi:hypothetical protein
LSERRENEDEEESPIQVENSQTTDQQLSDSQVVFAAEKAIFTTRSVASWQDARLPINLALTRTTEQPWLFEGKGRKWLV